MAPIGAGWWRQSALGGGAMEEGWWRQSALGGGANRRWAVAPIGAGRFRDEELGHREEEWWRLDGREADRALGR